MKGKNDTNDIRTGTFSVDKDTAVHFVIGRKNSEQLYNVPCGCPVSAALFR